LYGLVSSLLSVAVFEQRDKEEIELSDGTGRKFKYFSKPYEAFCKENLSFLFKVLKAQSYDGGLHTLISDSDLHTGSYKHLRVTLSRKGNNKGLSLTFSLAYLIQPGKNDMTLESIIGKSELAKCVFCTASTITIHQREPLKLYDAREVTEVVSLRSLAISGARTEKLKERTLQSERYIADLHFYKEGTFYHRLANTNSRDKLTVKLQEYFPSFIRPFLHELKIY
jgi:hypothetical protein